MTIQTAVHEDGRSLLRTGFCNSIMLYWLICGVFHCADRFCTSAFHCPLQKRLHEERLHQIYDGMVPFGVGGRIEDKSLGTSSSLSLQNIRDARAQQDMREILNFSVYNLSKWEYQHFVPPTVKGLIKEDVNSIHKKQLEVMKRLVQEEVFRSGRAANLESIFAAFDNFWDDCDTLGSEKKHVKSSVSFVDPVRVQLGSREAEYIVNGERYKTVLQDECMMFPFDKQLEAVLQCEALFNAMEDFRSKRFSTDGKIRSCFDAKEWKNDPFFSTQVGAYTVLFYYDDVTVTNPIGQYKRKVSSCI